MIGQNMPILEVDRWCTISEKKRVWQEVCTMKMRRWLLARLYDFQDCQRISEAEYLEALSSYAHLPFAYHGSYMAYKTISSKA